MCVASVQRLRSEQNQAATLIQSSARAHWARQTLRALQLATLSHAAVKLQSFARRRAALVRARTLAAYSGAAAVREAAASLVFTACLAWWRRQTAAGEVELQRRRELWRRAKELESEECKHAAEEAANERATKELSKRQLKLKKLQNEIAASLFQSSRDAAAGAHSSHLDACSSFHTW